MMYEAKFYGKKESHIFKIIIFCIRAKLLLEVLRFRLKTKSKFSMHLVSDEFQRKKNNIY